MLAIGEKIKDSDGKEYTIIKFEKSTPIDTGDYTKLQKIDLYLAESDGVSCKLKITFDAKDSIKKIIEL